ncbi:hypothetical protein [Ferrimonas marina]|uniref:Uncharacterized protein n=1 Tax=Ferrimonas marina TaxID=299255 RepID=A0A1M5TRW1_9GAMM|nr:hypothetical protein [Ferrimonas marina]SHH53400.1 hypothetical protein SAMN02745129_2251 [Ferrimonas marina]
MSAKPTIAPCFVPGCESDRVDLQVNNEGGTWVACQSCGCMGPMVYEDEAFEGITGAERAAGEWAQYRARALAVMQDPQLMHGLLQVGVAANASSVSVLDLLMGWAESEQGKDHIVRLLG